MNLNQIWTLKNKMALKPIKMMMDFRPTNQGEWIKPIIDILKLNKSKYMNLNQKQTPKYKMASKSTKMLDFVSKNQGKQVNLNSDSQKLN